MEYIYNVILICIIVCLLGLIENFIIIGIIKFFNINNYKGIKLDKLSNTKYIDYYLENIIYMKYENLDIFKEKYIYDKKIYIVLSKLDLEYNERINNHFFILKGVIDFKIVFCFLCVIYSFITANILDFFGESLILFLITNFIVYILVVKYNISTNNNNMNDILEYKFKNSDKNYKEDILLVCKIILDKINYRLNVNTYSNLININIGLISFVLLCISNVYNVLSSNQDKYIYKEIIDFKEFYKITNYIEENAFFYIIIDVFEKLMIVLPIIYFIIFCYLIFNARERGYNENLIFLKSCLEKIINEIKEE